jgi:hypothetical protein
MNRHAGISGRHPILLPLLQAAQAILFSLRRPAQVIFLP